MQALDIRVDGDSPEARAARRIAAAEPGAARDAEAELYRLLAPRARRFGLRHLRDAHAAADLMQQVMTLTIEQLRSGRLREPERILSFVLGACRLTVMDQRRGERRREDLLERYADALAIADVHVAPRLDHERVADCLDRLPERERSVLVMTFFDDQPSEAVGQQLGCSAGNVRVIRHRGIDRLRTLRRLAPESGMSAAAPNHPSVEALLDYWLDDGDAAASAAIDEHLMQCEPCGRALDDLVALGEGVRAAFRSGAVSAMASDAFLKRVVGHGVHVREYRLPHNGSVNCTVAPDDELLVAHLETPLQDVERLDAVVTLSFEPDVQHRLQDVPFDAQTGEVLWMPKFELVRSAPAHTAEVMLLSVDAGGAHELGRYTFHHQPWPGR